VDQWSPELKRYYKSDAWQELRHHAMKRDGYRCRACGIKPDRKKWWQFWKRANWLHVHHMDYSAWSECPGSEPLSDLITLDRSCHEEVHARHRSGSFAGSDESLRECTMYVVGYKQARLARQRAKQQRKLA
jgi:predicted HNH restriction endonuclease